MKEYIILLPNEKTRTYRFVTMLILLINCMAFGFVLMNAADKNIKIICALAVLTSLVSLIIVISNFYTKKFSAYRTDISFIFLSIIWFLLGKYLFAVFIVCFAILEFYASRKFKVVFTADKILYPSFPIKTFLWNEVNNVILKDNVLTIDLNNNKLIQVVIEKESADEIDEYSFNEFCRQRIKG